MRAYQIIDWGQPLQECEVPVPEPQGTEVLIKVTACGICHSDIHIWDGYFDLGGGRKLSLKAGGMSLPFTMGHEPVGEVVGLGPDTAGVKIGDKRVVYPWIGCGECNHCTNDDELLCTKPRTVGVTCAGGYAEYLIVPDARYLLAYDGVDEAVAATAACSGVTAYSALKKVSHLAASQSLLIIGAGGVGLAGIGMAKAVVGARVIVADIDSAKRDAALAAGADEVIDNSDAGARRSLMAMTGGGADAVVDFVGAPATSEFGFSVLAKGATMVVVGLYGGAMQIPISMLPLKVVNMAGSYVGTRQDLVELLQLLRNGKAKPVPHVKRPLQDAPVAISELREGKAVGRFVLINF